MQAQDVLVVRTVVAWQSAGLKVWLATVIETYGSAPRPVGSMAAINDLGQVVGSVSGGCVDDDLSAWLVRDANASSSARALTYGRDADERARLRLPCNGHLRIWLEPAPEVAMRDLQAALARGVVMHRDIDLSNGNSSLSMATTGSRTGLQGSHFGLRIGPTARLVLIGASEVSRYLAPMAIGLGFRVTVVDPRREYLEIWPHHDCELLDAMPDDAIAANPPDLHTAVVALSHDPKLDDMGLLEALKTQAFYIGAMGSFRTTQARKERLDLFDLEAGQIDRLHGPVGLDIGARTPPEIAISIAADLVRFRRMP